MQSAKWRTRCCRRTIATTEAPGPGQSRWRYGTAGRSLSWRDKTSGKLAKLAKMLVNPLTSADHDRHALEWRSQDLCLLCVIDAVQGQNGKIHKRFALSSLMQRLSVSAAISLSQQDAIAQKNLTGVLHNNRHVSAKLLLCLLGQLFT